MPCPVLPVSSSLRLSNLCADSLQGQSLLAAWTCPASGPALGVQRNKCAEIPGGYGGGVTPLPIPNREVKPSCADGTAGESPWESRLPPGYSEKAGVKTPAFFFLFGKEVAMPQSTVSDVAHVIQLAVAPVFLLSGVGALLGVLTSRLGRIIDRARSLEGRLAAATPAESASLHSSLATLS